MPIKPHSPSKLTLNEFASLLNGQTSPDLLVNDHTLELSSRHPSYTSSPDGWMAAIRTAKWLNLEAETRNPPLAKVFFAKELEPRDLLLESLIGIGMIGIPDNDFAAKVTDYWQRVCRLRVINGNIPETLPLKVLRGDDHLEFDFKGPIALALPFSVRDQQGYPVSTLSRGHRNELLPTCFVFFATRFARLRHLVASLPDPKHHTTAHKFDDGVRKIRGVILSMSLYYASIKGNESKLGFTRTVWETLAGAAQATDEIFGNAGRVENRSFLVKHRANLEAWFGGAARWWSPHREVDQRLLVDNMKEMKVALFELFEIEDTETAHSIYKSRLRSFDSPFFPVPRRF